MARKQVNVFDALVEVIKEKKLETIYQGNNNNCKEVISQSEFNTIMLLANVTTNRRKMNDFWKLIGDLGLLQQINQSDKYFILLDRLYNVLLRVSPQQISEAKDRMKMRQEECTS
ncbi:MAG: hypothetical protein WCS15_06185 [Prevotella sp.]